MECRAAIALAVAICLPVEAGQRAPAPGPHCADARTVREVVQADEYTLAVRLADESRWRVDLASRCPAIAEEPDVRLVSPAGWVCGRENETVVGAARACPIANVARIDARTFSTHALQATRSPRPGVLDTVTVQGARRRGFTGSPAYCFNTNHLRAWHEDADGIVVEVAPRRSGGHRFYRVELGASCQGLTNAAHLSFRSGVGGAMICGFAGDRAMFQTELEAAGYSGQFYGPIGNRSRVGRAEQILGVQLPALSGCPVAQVYPIDPAKKRPLAALSPQE